MGKVIRDRRRLIGAKNWVRICNLTARVQVHGINVCTDDSRFGQFVDDDRKPVAMIREVSKGKFSWHFDGHIEQTSGFGELIECVSQFLAEVVRQKTVDQSRMVGDSHE